MDELIAFVTRMLDGEEQNAREELAQWEHTHPARRAPNAESQCTRS
jgi:hypothetical protein